MSPNISSRTKILMMTATITPPPGVNARSDPAVRLGDYSRALSFYLQQIGRGIDRIVFIENSNSDLTTLRSLADKAGLIECCEFIGFAGLDYPSAYGYGYGEFKLLDHGMAEAQALHEIGSRSIVTKVTGRYIVRNLMRLLRHLPDEVDVMCDIRKRTWPWVDMRVMCWTPEGYQAVLRGVYSKLRDDLNRLPPEMVLSRHLMESQSRASIQVRFPFELHVRGARGYDNRDWMDGHYFIKHYVRACARQLLPWYPV
jgi:hypothetical protein